MLNNPLDTLVNTQTDSTTGVRMADATTANTVVSSYKKYYRIYIRCMNNAMSSTDSTDLETLAGQCPFTHGSVVYSARALYNAINSKQRVFTYLCDADTVDSGGYREGQVIGGAGDDDNNEQSYTLSPNPNDGTFVLTQLLNDTNPIKMEITNTIGQTIYADECLFSNQKHQVTTKNIYPGLYVLKLVDSENRRFVFKFVVR